MKMLPPTPSPALSGGETEGTLLGRPDAWGKA